MSSVVVPGTYRLQREDGTDVGNPWNIEHLRRFYPWKNGEESYVLNPSVINKVQSFQLLVLVFPSPRLVQHTRGLRVSRPDSPTTSLLSVGSPQRN